MEVGRIEWARMRLHSRMHRAKDCSTCSSVEYERRMQAAAVRVRQRMLRDEDDDE